MNATTHIALLATDNYVQNISFDQPVESTSDEYFLCHADPADATVHTIDNFPALECNGIVLRRNNKAIEIDTVYTLAIEISRKDTGIPATGTATIVITDLPGSGTNTYGSEALFPVAVTQNVMGASPSIVITFSGSGINLQARVLLIGKKP